MVHPQDGETDLMFACGQGHLDVARLLLDRGAKVDAASSEVGPVQYTRPCPRVP
jgi:ankyrin repeat protein